MDYVDTFLEFIRKAGNLVASEKINAIEIVMTKYLELGKDSDRV